MRARPMLPIMVAVGLLTTGCAGTANSQATAFAQEDGKQALVASLAGLKAGNYRFIRTGISSLSGVADLPTGALTEQGTTVGGGKWEKDATLVANGKQYVRRALPSAYRNHLQDAIDGKATEANGGATFDPTQAKIVRATLTAFNGKTWAQVHDSVSADVHALPTPTAARPDVTGATELLENAVTATKKGNTITGTLDGTKSGRDGELFGAEPAGETIGLAATAMQYTAVLDTQNRLSRLTVNVPTSSRLSGSSTPEANSPAPIDESDASSFQLTINVTAYGTAEMPSTPTNGPVLTRDVVEFVNTLG